MGYLIINNFIAFHTVVWVCVEIPSSVQSFLMGHELLDWKEPQRANKENK